jgi:hypothetical protein
MVDESKAIAAEAVRAISEQLDRKAHDARFWGRIYIGVSVSLGLAIIVYFYQSSSIPRALQQGSGLSDLFADSGTIVLRIGMVLIAIFIIQILVGFARYYFRLAEHLSMSADIIRLSDGHGTLIKELSSVLLPTFDFGKMPTSPIQRIVDSTMETIQELVKKIPSR